MQLRQMLFVSGVLSRDDELIENAVGLALALESRLSALTVLGKSAKDDEATFRRTRLQQRAAKAQYGMLPVLIEKEPRHADAVRRAVDEGGFDCIAVAKPARRSLNAAISVKGFAAVLRTAHVPVVALPPRTQPPEEINKVVLQVSFNAASQRVLDHTIELCQRLGAALELVYVFDVENPPEPTPERAAARSPRALIEMDQRTMAEMKDRAMDAGIPTTSTFLEGATDKAFAAYVADHKPDLVVLANRGARRVADIFAGSLTDRILSHIRCPAVLVRA